MSPIAIYPYKEDSEIRKMRVQAWFRAVVLASKLTPRELEMKFSESDSSRKVKRSCVWDKYRRGEVVPRRGPRPDKKPNLVDRVEATYPGTAKWLALPLWRLLDKAPLEMSEIRRYLDGLPNLMRQLFVYQQLEPSGVFWRRDTAFDEVCDYLLKFGDLDGFSALLALIREAEIVQDQVQHRYCMHKAAEFLSCMAFRQALSKTLISGISSYLMRRASTMGYFYELSNESDEDVELATEYSSPLLP